MMTTRKTTTGLAHTYFGQGNNRYYLGSLAEVIGISRKGQDFILWLHNGNRLEVPDSHQLTVIDGM
jgi:hypothetical protein